MHSECIKWERSAPRRGECDLRAGVQVIKDFPDPTGALETAYADFRAFLRSAGIPSGLYPVRTLLEPTGLRETYRLVADHAGCRIMAGDTEGIRRGLVFLEDAILGAGGPFLAKLRVKRRPVVRTRISRCFFGPINRPPKCRDELADDVDYYPSEYLNRLAHDGINGLWLTIKFADTVPSKIIPEYGVDAERRLQKLQATVERCLRYGIRIYVFCIEPAALVLDGPILAAHPELGGHRTSTHAAFCPSTRRGRAYLEEATRTLFTRVKGLGGMIDIPVGERFTHCASSGAVQAGLLNCSHCAGRKAWQILGDVLSALERGMHAAAPEAELIAWPYTQGSSWGLEQTVEAAGHLPPGVILQHNFESYGWARQLGRWRRLGDYWLSYAGPSQIFRDCARRARQNGTRMFAKLQVACSHEVASVPYVPVPGILHTKYQAIHKLGVSGAMLCWYFGNYPSLMNKAASELSFAPFPRGEKEFLTQLARRYWAAHAPVVARAWHFFRRGYEQYPHTALFGYYGPMHDGPVWPLHLQPANAVLSPTWQICYPPSGDRVGEAIGTSHTWPEILLLCKRMSDNWRRGTRLLTPLLRDQKRSLEQKRDIGVAQALDLQFRSGYNILLFYALREKLFASQNLSLRRRLGLLSRMSAIAREELTNSRALLALAKRDARLGFHSEAEGYKYYPARLQWRMRQLQGLLKNDFPSVKQKLRHGEVLFPEYTGAKPQGAVYLCKRMAKAPALQQKPKGGVWDALPVLAMNACLVPGQTLPAGQRGPYGFTPLVRAARSKFPGCVVKLGYSRTHLYLGAICRANRNALRDAAHKHVVSISFEPQRLWPPLGFALRPNSKGAAANQSAQTKNWQYHVQCGTDEWWAVLQIPLADLNFVPSRLRPIRLNVVYACMLTGKQQGLMAWVAPKPLPGRLIYGSHNPATDFGWLTPE